MGMNTIKGLRKTYKRDMARQVKRNDEATQNMLIEAKGRVRDEQEEVIEQMYAIQDLEGDVKVANDDFNKAIAYKKEYMN